MEEIGSVKHICRYPVKSMRGEDLDEVIVSTNGIVGDRVYAFVDNDAPDKRFPWMTARQANEMLLMKPSFVSVPSDVQIEVEDQKQQFAVKDESLEKLLEERYGYNLHLKFDTDGIFDSKPISLFGLDTVRELEKETSMNLNFRRFRANFYARWTCGKPFYEDDLVGRELQLGREVRINVVEKDSRCVIPTLDPDTSRPSPEVLRAIQSKHRGCAGVYATVSRAGVVKLNDPIYLT
jgi:uncharacterized protein